mmetsp:Transcript_30743/g.95134  ORF Transcript_30743/g.95134 Transcript_30743/m.95134 type:complete len:331 (-) Transcript_30743:19-1011(-)
MSDRLAESDVRRQVLVVEHQIRLGRRVVVLEPLRDGRAFMAASVGRHTSAHTWPVHANPWRKMIEQTSMPWPPVPWTTCGFGSFFVGFGRLDPPRGFFLPGWSHRRSPRDRGLTSTEALERLRRGSAALEFLRLANQSRRARADPRGLLYGVETTRGRVSTRAHAARGRRFGSGAKRQEGGPSARAETLWRPTPRTPPRSRPRLWAWCSASRRRTGRRSSCRSPTAAAPRRRASAAPTSSSASTAGAWATTTPSSRPWRTRACRSNLRSNAPWAKRARSCRRARRLSRRTPTTSIRSCRSSRHRPRSSRRSGGPSRRRSSRRRSRTSRPW